MVNALSKTGREAVHQAIAELEQNTSAKFSAVIAPASDAYQSYFIIYGLCLGSVVSMALWIEKLVADFPLLLVIQLIAIALFSFIPCLRHMCMRLVPKRVRHHRAAHRAYEEYLILSRHASPAIPFVLLYVSLAERYAHILTSRSVHEKIPDDKWNAVINEFTAAMSKEGLESACMKAIKHAAQLLTSHFPKSPLP